MPGALSCSLLLLSALTLAAAQTFAGTPVASPQTVSAGSLVSVSFSLSGGGYPVTAYVVGGATYSSGLCCWATYPLDDQVVAAGQVTGTIPAGAVSSGSYYIVLRAATGAWSSGAAITVGPVAIQVSPTTFRAYDSVTVTWPAGATSYPVDVLIVGELLNGVNANDIAAVVLGSASSGTSLTALVTLDHVSAGNYLVYARWPSATGPIYSRPNVPVTAAPYEPNPVAVYDRAAAFTVFRWAFLAYLPQERLQAWVTSQVCQQCPACAQTSSAASLAYIEGDVNGAAYLLTTAEGLVVLSFRGSVDSEDYASDAKAARTTYMGCGSVDACGLHRGFYDVYKALAPALIQAVHLAIPGAQRATTPIVVTGHSLGGALATIAAYELAVAGYLVRGVYTFGSPRVGNAAFAAAFTMAVARALPNFYDDIVLPPVTADLRRRGEEGAAQGSAWPLMPSALMLAALGEQGIALPGGAGEADFWRAWNERAAGRRMRRGPGGPGSAAGARRALSDATPGAGLAAETYRGCWRVAVCSDPITYLPGESLGYEHAGELVSVDPQQPEYYRLKAPLPPASGSCAASSVASHLEASYGAALLADAAIADYVVTLQSSQRAWSSPGGAVDCAGVPPGPSPSPTLTPSPSASPSAANPAPSSSSAPAASGAPSSAPPTASPPPSASPTPTPTPTASPSAGPNPSASSSASSTTSSGGSSGGQAPLPSPAPKPTEDAYSSRAGAQAPPAAQPGASNTAAIAGGVGGGLAALAVGALAARHLLRGPRQQPVGKQQQQQQQLGRHESGESVLGSANPLRVT